MEKNRVEGDRYLNAWFLEERIDDHTIAISEYGHSERSHSYLLIGSQRALLIDTGLGIGNIRDVVAKYVDLKRVLVVSTHIHWDHIGGHQYFDQIFAPKREISWLVDQFPLGLDMVKKNFADDHFYHKKPKWFNVNDYQIYRATSVQAVDDSDLFDLGNRCIACIHTPGHSPGHLCFFEKETGYLFTGDLIYRGTIFVNYPSTDPELYQKSIHRLNERVLEIRRLLPSHHDLDVDVGLIHQMRQLLNSLARKNQLRHGAGFFSNGEISILL